LNTHKGVRRRLAGAVLTLAAAAAVRADGRAASPPLARESLTAGWATFGIALPAGAVPAGLKIGNLPTQTDVKVRWPDGSARFAVVTAKVFTSGTYDVAPAPTPPAIGQRVATLPQASVTLVIEGQTYTAALVRPAGVPEYWLDGPLVSEVRTTVAPGMHPFLRVIFDARSYADGAGRVDVTVENCLDVAGADQVKYDVAITVAGRRVFEHRDVTHKYLARWRQSFATAGLREAAVTPDLAPFIASRAIPAYLPTIDSPPRALTGDGVSGTGFDILGFGDLTLPMNAHSGRPELAPYPDWAAQYLVHRRPDEREYLVRHGELAGSWGVHVRDVDGSLPDIDRAGQGYYWLDPRWRDPGNRSAGFTGPRGNLDHRAEPGDNAHQPSLAYIPYLITGEHYFADEIAFWANFCLIGSFASDDNRKGPQGLLIGNEVRGIGWALRNMADAAAYLPDGYAIKTTLAEKVLNNLKYLDQYASSFDSGPVRTLFPGRRPEDSTPPYQGYVWISIWEQSYVAWAIDHAIQQRYLAGLDASGAGAQMRDRIARLQLNLFTNPEWPRDADRQAPYLLAAGRWPPGGERIPAFFSRFSEVAAATFSVPSPAHPDFVRPFEGYYGPEARLLLMICDRLGERSAASSLAALMAHATDGVRMTDDLNRRSGWAIAQ